MTVFDLVIMTVVALVLVFLFRQKTLRRSVGIWLITVGLFVIGAFYASDLATMHLLPRFMPFSEAMGYMRSLHLEYNWWVSLISIVAIAFGIVIVTRELLDNAQQLRQEIADRKAAQERREELESQLRQAGKMEALGVLAGGIAHDFNNILAIILGNSELLRTGLPEDHERRPQLDNIVTSGKRAADLVQQILAFSRVESSATEVIDLSATVDEALRMGRATLPANIEIRSDIPAEPLHMQGNETQIHQIILNLCSNAYASMMEKGGVLQVNLKRAAGSTAARPVGGDVVAELSVIDEGEGIPADQAERVFEPFYTTKEVGKGTGLGLSMVYGIVESHGGKIEMKSELGVGTRFTLYFPLTDSDPSEASPNASIPAAVSGHILIVDDEEALTDLYSRFLTGKGLRVTVAGNGRIGQQLFDDDPQAFDVVVTDHAMPELTGTELSRHINAARPGLPVILLSGLGDNGLPESAGDGIHRVLAKPLELDELYHEITGSLLDASSRRAAIQGNESLDN